VLAALEQFKFGPRNGKPTAIICNAIKGQGAFSDFMNKHKVTVPENLVAQEVELQQEQRQRRISEAVQYLEELDSAADGTAVRDLLLDAARDMHLKIEGRAEGKSTITTVPGPVLARRVPKRDKSVRYNEAALPKLDPKKNYTAAEIVTSAMKVFARDTRVVSIDSDLASTSGLEAGIAAVDQQRAMNAGVAEANMMLIGEAFAALGSNAWVSTFCPFFNWQVMRRIAVGHQERLEAIEAADGWLSEGHGLDLTFLATAANFETRTNGATHMGNDDITTFDAVAHLKIIDVSCPQQLLSIMKWIMQGNRGLNYVRVMRTDSAVLYGGDYIFTFNKGYKLRESENDQAVIISSGRGVHEALAASEISKKRGLNVGVVDMPSVDGELLRQLHASSKLLIFAEQNNGYLWQNFLKILYSSKDNGGLNGSPRVMTINTLNADGKPQFIHSATYEELIAAFGLTPSAIADSVESGLAAVK